MLTKINPLVNNDNLIINPCMRYWQRDVSVSAAHPYLTYFRGYSADRWSTNIAGTTVVSRQTLTASSPMMIETPDSEYFLRYAGSSGTGDFDLISQSIRNIGNATDFLSNTWMTLSFWAKTDTGNPTMKFALRRFFNENNWADGGTDVAYSNSFQLTTSWQ
ncbi:MAG: hypothetical protein R3321_09205 [Nitrososphaeraceae archaeon]|nr:hypothetical protein [Nitrososphaeraceae archaeon]